MPFCKSIMIKAGMVSSLVGGTVSVFYWLFRQIPPVLAQAVSQ
jgi:hypothetical protein